MAEKIVYSDIVKAYQKQLRIRNVNYRSSLLSTIANIDMSNGENKDDYFICTLPYSASIRSIRLISKSGNFKAVKFRLKISAIPEDGMPTLKNDGSAVESGILPIGLNLTGNPAKPDIELLVPDYELKSITLTNVQASGGTATATPVSNDITRYELCPFDIMGKTLYQLLCDASGNPKDAFEPYKHDRLCAISLVIDTTGPTTKPTAGETLVEIVYADNGSSNSQLTSLTIDKEQ